jgi:hypothetical protein
MVIVKRFDINPYFVKIADYYWDYLDISEVGSIWDWLKTDYDIIKIGPMGDKRGSWVSIPEENYSAFLLRWS